jgi:hypothetical protein
MLVYRVVGRTAPLDWASMAEDKDLGLFKTKKAAQSKIDKLYEDKYWPMDWAGFFIEKVKVSG